MLSVLKSLSFRWKLLATFAVIVMMAISTLGIYSYQRSLKILEETTRTNFLGSLDLVKENIMYKILELNKISDQFYLDETIQRIFLNKLDAEKNYYLYNEYLIPKFESTLNMSSDFLWISLYTNNETMDEKYYDNEKKSFDTVKGYEIRTIKDDDGLWYNQLNNMPIENYWLEVEDDLKNGAISLIKPMVNFDHITPIGWLRINVKKKDVFQAIDSKKLGEMSDIYIKDRETGHVIYGSHTKERKSEEDFLIIEQAINDDQWTLIAQIPKSEWKGDISDIRRATILACLITFAIIMLVSFILTKILTQKIHKISQAMNEFKEGGFQERIPFKSNDEFAVIARSFNEMAHTIEDLINKVYRSDISKKEAELHMLQNQINPHFLYNTLSTISSLAKLGELDQMHQMVLGLAKFYRLIMNTGVMIIPLDLELQQVQAYVDIQKIKYGDALEVVYDINCDPNQIVTLKLLLQPFLENALIHAWHQEALMIHVRCRTGHDRVYLEVEDNGCGIEPGKVMALNGDLNTSGYGIRNVKERIQLYYGNDYGVTISSELGKGTFIHIVIPLET